MGPSARNAAVYDFRNLVISSLVTPTLISRCASIKESGRAGPEVIGLLGIHLGSSWYTWLAVTRCARNPDIGQKLTRKACSWKPV